MTEGKFASWVLFAELTPKHRGMARGVKSEWYCTVRVVDTTVFCDDRGTGECDVQTDDQTSCFENWDEDKPFEWASVILQAPPINNNVKHSSTSTLCLPLSTLYSDLLYSLAQIFSYNCPTVVRRRSSSGLSWACVRWWIDRTYCKSGSDHPWEPRAAVWLQDLICIHDKTSSSVRAATTLYSTCTVSNVLCTSDQTENTRLRKMTWNDWSSRFLNRVKVLYCPYTRSNQASTSINSACLPDRQKRRIKQKKKGREEIFDCLKLDTPFLNIGQILRLYYSIYICFHFTLITGGFR